MDSARWERLQLLFHEAAGLPACERPSFLEKSAGGDEDLIADAMAMLVEDAGGSSLFDRDVAQVASHLLGNADGAPLPTRDFGPYKLRAMLGEGGMGVVYLAEREDLGSLAAIKILRDAWMSPSRRERFRSEQRTLAQLNHPSIARLYDANTLPDGTPWFVMEYVDGVQLTDYCIERNCSIDERLKLFRAVCEAVQYAHEHAIIHRDLKPSNILVKRDGAIRLLDFGIAKHLDPLETPPDRTRTGVRLMTPAYAAPEQLRGEPAGVHTDVYSLGVILYELLTGRLPLAIPAASGPAKPSTSARKTTGTASWADLDVLCLKAMHEDQKRRYPSAAALIRDVDHYLCGEPLEARSDTLGYIFGKFVRRHWRVLPAAALIFGVGVGLALLVGFRGKAPAVRPRPRTVAVLPFHNTGSDGAVDFLRVALPDELTTILGYMRSASVRPFAASARYTQADLDPRKVGRELGVATLVTGNFVRAGAQLQVTLEAFDVESNRSAWRDVFNVPAGNMVAMQAEVAAKARAGLGPLLGSVSPETETAIAPKSEEAYDLYLRSTALSGDLSFNKQAIALLERAVKLDPSYPPALWALSGRYYYEARYANGGKTMVERSIATGDRARALDPNNITGVASLAITLSERGELAEAYRDADAVARRYPDNARAQFALAYVLRYAGMLDEAASHCEAALLLDAQTGVRSCAVVFILRGDYRSVADYIRYDRDSEWVKAISVDSLVRQGKVREALAIAPERAPVWAGFDVLLAYLRHRPPEEVAALARTVQPIDDPEENYFAAAHLAYCGQTSAALEMLKRAIEGNYCSYPAIDSDPFLDSLRGRSEFPKIRAAAAVCQTRFLAARNGR